MESVECRRASLLSQLKWLLMLMYRSGSMSLHLWPQLDRLRLDSPFGHVNEVRGC